MILQTITYMSPILSALACIAILLIYGTVSGKAGHHPRHTLLGYYTSFVFTWSCTFIYIFIPSWFAYVNPLAYTSYLLMQVTLYHFTYSLTRLEGDRPFSFIHYLIPTLPGVILASWSFFIPPETLQASSMGNTTEGYEAFTALSESKKLVQLVFTTIYLPLSIYRLARYKKVVINFSSDERKNSLNWLTLTVMLSIVLLFPPLILSLFSEDKIISSPIIVFPILVFFVQHALLCYNMLAENYVFIYSSEDSLHQQLVMRTRKEATLDKKGFELYMKTARPYLQPDLKITNLADLLDSNRTYLSMFINQTYNISFSLLINEYRLRELDNLLKNQDNSKYSNMELIARAGFGSYASYLRAKQNHNKTATLPPEISPPFADVLSEKQEFNLPFFKKAGFLLMRTLNKIKPTQ